MGDIAPREQVQRKAAAICEEMEIFFKEHGELPEKMGNPVLLSFLIGKFAELDIKCAMLMEVMG